MSPRSILGAIAAGLVLAVTSLLVNVIVLGAAHEGVDALRPDDHPLRMPGLAITSLVWGALFVGGYRWVWRRREGTAAGWRDGVRYGATVCVLFTWIQSVFLFQFVRIPVALLVGDLVHYLLASCLAGALVGHVERRGRTSPRAGSPSAPSAAP